MLKRTFLSFLLLFSVLPGQELIDGIAAIVGDNIILLSEVDQLARLNASQFGINPALDKEKYNTLRNMALRALIEDKILVEQAKVESIEVSDREVEDALNQRIDYIIQQAGSKEKAEELLGGPLSKIKRDYRPIIRNMLLVEKLKSQKFNDVKVTRQEVEEFYKTYRDSLPEIPPVVDFSHILIEIKPGEREIREALKLLDSIKTLIQQGQSFEELAKKFSEDPGTAPYGGDLGYIKRGDFIKSFEEVAFSLSPGEISDVVKTDIGFHLIKFVDRKGEKVRVKHILVRPKVTERNVEEALNKIKRIRDAIISGEISFDSAAYRYSDDPDAKTNFGRVERMPKNQIKQKEFLSVIDTLKAGEISQPFRTEMGFHIIILNAVYDDKWATLEQFALQLKKNRLYSEWIEKLKDNFYIEIKENSQ